MKIKAILSAAGLCLFASLAHADTTRNLIANVSFNQHSSQAYSRNLLEQDWNHQITWAGGVAERTRITQDPQNPRNRFLRVTYPANVVGPWHSGAQFHSELPAADEYWLTYKIRFNEGFDFKLGGKLPGLGSGDGRYAGGVKPWNGDGWTARLMWLRDGSIVPYLYYVGMPRERRFGDFWDTGAKVKRGQWHEITQRVRLNTPGRENGLYEIWFDGKRVAHRWDMNWRTGHQGRIDAFLFSTFHGGASLDWAPDWHSFADFDDIRISRIAPPRIQHALMAQASAR